MSTPSVPAEALNAWQIEFKSAEFLPYLPEDCQENPGVYGYELAHWLSRALADQGIFTSYPLGEDWGWLLEYLGEDVEITIACTSITDQEEGYKGLPVQWSIALLANNSASWFSKKKKVSIPPHLPAAIVSALQVKGISVLRVELTRT
jgi:hypothetical protein